MYYVTFFSVIHFKSVEGRFDGSPGQKIYMIYLQPHDICMYAVHGCAFSIHCYIGKIIQNTMILKQCTFQIPNIPCTPLQHCCGNLTAKAIFLQCMLGNNITYRVSVFSDGCVAFICHQENVNTVVQLNKHISPYRTLVIMCSRAPTYLTTHSPHGSHDFSHVYSQWPSQRFFFLKSQDRQFLETSQSKLDFESTQPKTPTPPFRPPPKATPPKHMTSFLALTIKNT